MYKNILHVFLLTGLLLIIFPPQIHAQQSKTVSGEQHAIQLQQQLQTVKQDTAKYSILEELIEFYINTKPQSAETYIKEGITLALSHKDLRRQIVFHLQNLRLLNQQGQFKATLDQSASVKTLIQQYGTPKQQTFWLMSTANAGQRLGMYDSAATIYNTVIRISHTDQLKEIEVQHL